MFDTLALTPQLLDSRDINLIGLGSVGSGLFQNLYRILAGSWNGTIVLWDPQTVEARNRFNQKVFAFNDKRPKVESMGRIARAIERETELSLVLKHESVTSETKLSGFVISAVDSMVSRKAVWPAVVNNSDDVPLYIDLRMGMTGGRVYALSPANDGHISQYQDPKHFYDDPQDADPACKSEFPFPFISDTVGAHAYARFVEWCHQEKGSFHPYMNFFEFDFRFRYPDGKIGYYSSGEYWDDPAPGL